MLLFEREYDGGESLVDVERDIYEALNGNDDLATDEHGFAVGYFTVTISWRKDYE